MQTTLLAKFFYIFQCLLTQNPTNQGSKSSRSYGTTGTSTELFLAKNDFKTSSTVNFPKKCPLSGDQETNQRHEPQAT